ncbi:type 4 prepilin-like proteins leader peptide processing enzyme [marine gamma proteobacterium HTCC2207]|jgi:leader peptidase (prepilin peptidase)/N-methyltransferase|uniref:Prepilin leader peptidase/N-methyltransferase n=1 Tax=gamma proteobacterium HTCC2207 TaxID=314287 RepID=Q1YSB8_9GAMM|nr:type 4 prepilin-like proteins leader peptide processing enzyme [marine gamma proteobacterium HTCC2207] [gamma proteobacterium HTCC2207]MDB4427249.1 A24 family peptidase [Porticoccaceae bacterium]MDB4581294.1 A24 family peptidase [Porticoccaceae bacterium]MDC0589647.1 A24 family peptidase [Porticoccaceae bacterium]
MLLETGLSATASLSATALAIAAFPFGLIIGSFLNVVILRFPEQLKNSWRRESEDFLGLTNALAEESAEPEEVLSLSAPASRCPSCGVPIKPWHNIPLVSYVLLRGKCKACSTPISIQYPLVELVSALATAFIVFQFGQSLMAAYCLMFTWVLIALTGIDFREQLLPDQITLPLLWLGLFANLNGTFVPLNEAVVGALAGYLSLWSVFWLFKLITGKEGMGYGDFKLLAALGAWMGWQMLPLIIILSTFVGALVGVAGLLMNTRERQVPMAFGPFLAMAGWIALIWGDKILGSYLSVFGL